MLTNFKNFLADDRHDDMYITGPAGSGKTTDLSYLVQHCMDNGIPYIVCAFTHKACGVLRAKLPTGAAIVTLHSYLKKRPTVNSEATKLKHIESNSRMGMAELAKVVFIDEYSNVGEKDQMDVREAQDEHEFKIVWLGDPHQLPPVGDAQTVKPHGKYSFKLTHIYRQAADNTLHKPLSALVSYIEGAQAEPLRATEHFIRGKDIVAEYLANSDSDKVMLAYTNKRVQLLNAEIQGRLAPEPGDTLFSPTTKQHYEFVQLIDPVEVHTIDLPFSGAPLSLGTKYKTLEHLTTMQVQFMEVVTELGEQQVLAVVFGHQSFNIEKLEYKVHAANSNSKLPCGREKPSVWAKANNQHSASRARAKAWRDFLTFNDCVACLDFAHAMTVHKSQGSTYKYVYLDTEDLAQVADRDFMLYLKLMYVGTSRASFNVITN